MANISILGGTGALGAALAVRLGRAGHRIHIGSRDAEKAHAFIENHADWGLEWEGGDLRHAAAAGEVCFLSVPYSAHGATLAAVGDLLKGRILVDCTAPLRPPNVGTVQLPVAGSAAVEARQALGAETRVVSALQTVGAQKLASGGAVDGDVLVASDDADAAETVCALLAQMGLRAWFVGPLANSAAAEAMTSVLIQINRRYKRVQSGLRITGIPREQAAAPGAGSAGVTITPLRGMPMLNAGDDLAEALSDAVRTTGLAPVDGDVLVVAQKVVSKAEGRAVRLTDVAVTSAGEALARESGKSPALAELILGESAEVVRVRPGLVIARHRRGPVLANAGIDASNVAPLDAPDTVLLWPKNPDESAQRLRIALERIFGVRLAVVISDSLGRAWRMGTVGTAIGVSGMKPLRDRRGKTDLFGRTLQATIVGTADEIASAASLVIGEAAEAVPAAWVRGVIFAPDAMADATGLLRPLTEDLFR